MESKSGGLSTAEADSRAKQYGLNEIAREKRKSPLKRLLENVRNPLVILLGLLGVVAYLTGDLRATVVILVMVFLGVVLRFFQEMRADNAAEKLKAMVSTTATVVRDGKKAEVPLQKLVPGDIILLAAGDMVPGDVRLLSAKDLFLNQAALTGESLPVEKTAAPAMLLETRIGEQFDAIVTGAADKGTWVRLLHPPIEGRLESGFKALDVGHRLRVQLVRTDVERGYIDFKRVV